MHATVTLLTVTNSDECIGIASYGARAPLDFRQYFFQLTYELRQVYNSQLYLVPYSLSL